MSDQFPWSHAYVAPKVPVQFFRNLSRKWFRRPPADGYWPPIFQCHDGLWHHATDTFCGGGAVTACGKTVAGLTVCVDIGMRKGALLPDARRVARDKGYLVEAAAEHCPDCFPWISDAIDQLNEYRKVDALGLFRSGRR